MPTRASFAAGAVLLQAFGAGEAGVFREGGVEAAVAVRHRIAEVVEVDSDAIGVLGLVEGAVHEGLEHAVPLLGTDALKRHPVAGRRAGGRGRP